MLGFARAHQSMRLVRYLGVTLPNACGMGGLPLVMGKSVIVCHLSIATRQPPSTRRQLRSMTNLLVSPPSSASTDCRRSRANVPEGKRKEVMMTYRKGKISLSCCEFKDFDQSDQGYRAPTCGMEAGKKDATFAYLLSTGFDP